MSSRFDQQLDDAGVDSTKVKELIAATIAEDLDGGVDVTTVSTVAATDRSRLDLVARASGIIAGVPVAGMVFQAVADAADSEVAFGEAIVDRTRVASGDVVLSITGNTRDLLTAERSALNLLGHLSGVATATSVWVDALAGGKTRVRDTRKTTPLLRSLEKYAVRCGGGVNHRMSLSDAALVKDNHVVAAGGVAAAFDAVRSTFPGLAVEVEVDSLDQLDEVVAAGAQLVLLDNFTIDQIREAVARVDGACELEASGGLTIDDAAQLATTGVDYVAVGALTHSAPVLDIGADLYSLG